jgi:hypothetical protein
MPNVTARYWGMRFRNDASVGEVQFYSPVLTGAREDLSEAAGNPYYSGNAATTLLTIGSQDGLDGDIGNAQAITSAAINELLAIDLTAQTAIRNIYVRNMSLVSPLPVPFAIDSASGLVGFTGDGLGKIVRYSVAIEEEYPSGPFLLIYTILPIAEPSDNPSIARGYITKTGVC